MRVLLDANIILDCLVLEKTGIPRAGKPASDRIIDLGELHIHGGLVAWHTLPIVSYYYGRQHSPADTASMIDALLTFLEIPAVGHADAIKWRSLGAPDFEDALQIACALAGRADFIISRNVSDFSTGIIPAMTPEDFLHAYP